jgi:two-component system phosphate regulon sensor histidine kinase PhoR
MIPSQRLYSLLVAGIGLVVVTCGGSFWLITREQERHHNAELTQQLLTEARMIRQALRGDGSAIRVEAAAGLIETLEQDQVRVAVIAADGTSAFSSDGAPDAASLLATTEVQRALSADWGTDIRPWGPEDLPYGMAAVPLAGRGPTRGIVWLARPLWAPEGPQTTLNRLPGLIGGIASIAVLILVVIFLHARRKAIQRVLQAARSFSAEDPAMDLDIAGKDELAVLSSSMDALRKRLGSKVETVDRQRQMLQGLIDQLQEGVIVARDDGRIALMNPAAARFLNLHVPAGGTSALVDQPVESRIPQRPLQQLLLGQLPAERDSDQSPVQAAASNGSVITETRLEVKSPTGTVHLLVRAAKLLLVEPKGTSEDAAVGYVVLLTDITELQRTIQMRTDFVANASHELRTPLSTIRAAVETLLAMDLTSETSRAVNFLETIDRHSARLQQMVADLLDLSQLESPTERFELESIETSQILEGLRARFAEALERKKLQWQADCESEDLDTIIVNPRLLRLVLDNLVDNAIKSTDLGGHIQVWLHRRDDSVVFEVADDGCGIPEGEQQRVFERFYQVQRSRSGAERGTGLGLSIVRHAVSAMKGSVRLESTVGEGTCVTVVVPQSRQPTARQRP